MAWLVVSGFSLIIAAIILVYMGYTYDNFEHRFPFSEDKKTILIFLSVLFFVIFIISLVMYCSTTMLY